MTFCLALSLKVSFLVICVYQAQKMCPVGWKYEEQVLWISHWLWKSNEKELLEIWEQ